ncbi:MAG TPA: D-amino-acid transaminase, partial [Bacteroidales bacterium]|nr:D-amino-acid transaminase [Bacteroidales bacterium]
MLRPATVYLNGQFMSKDKASISPDDRGFYFADGVYEVIKFYKGKPFCFDDHIDRLRNSLKQIKISFNDLDGLLSVCNALIEANNFKNKYAGIYLQITRGVANRTHRFPENDVKPTVYGRAFFMQNCMTEMTDGVVALTRDDIRWHLCNIKSISLLPNTLLFEEVADMGAFECILVRNGDITEATHSNVFAVRNGVVQTHPDSNLILPGITKKTVLKICKELDLDISEEPIKYSEISKYDEWFLTGTGSEVVPVVQINNSSFGNGKPGKITRKIQNEFLRKTYE